MASTMLKRSSTVKGIFEGFIRPLGFSFTQALALITSHRKRSSMLAASPSQLEHKKGTTMIATAEPMSLGAVTALPRTKSIKVWHEEEDDFSILERRVSTWIAGISTTEERYFKKYVYENPNMTDLDLRQHRAGLYLLMATGEEVAIDLLIFNGENSGNVKTSLVQNYVALIDQKLAELRETLHQWHGDPEQQADIPESFKQGMRDFEQGKVVDLQTALTTVPDGV